eukprot:COSAG02_NODE_1443_length_12584_cov_2.587425_3_plen_193_part_00
MAARRGVIEASALIGAAGTFWYFRLRENSPARPPVSLAPRRVPVPLSPSGSPLQLVNVQVVFRHGARMPNHDVLHPHDNAWTGPAAWTVDDTVWDSSQGAHFVLHDYKGNELAGGASNKRILNSSRKLAGGAVAGQLSSFGWEQMVKFGQALRHRYLGPPGPSSLVQPGELALSPRAVLTRCQVYNLFCPRH